MRLSRTGLPLFVLGLLIAVTGSSFAAESEARAAVPRDADAFERFGPYPVGVRTLVLVDTSRVDERAGGFRTLVTEVWYPAAPGAADKKPVTFSEFFAPHEEAASRFVRRFRAELEDVDRRFSSRAVRDAPMAEGVFPLLVFSHGNGGVRHQNTFQLDHLASHGYVIASPDHTGNAGIAPLPDRAVLYDRGGRSYAAAERPRDLSFVIDRLLAANTDASSFLHGSLDAEKIGALGHSFGGFTVCRAAEMDSRIRAILPMTVAWGKIVDVPVFVFLAGRDETVGAIGNGASKLYYQSARGPKYLLTIERGGHFSFTDMDAIRPSFGDGISEERGPDARFLPIDDAKSIIRRYGFAFFEAHLRGAADALRFIETDPASPELAYEHERAAPDLDEAIVRTSDSSNDDERSPALALARGGGPENERETIAQARTPEEIESAPAKPIRILLVTGADVPAHDWRETTPVTREALEASKAPVDVRVCEDPAILETDALHSYDVVVLNFRTPPPNDPSERARENLARFVRSGKGLVAIHFAVYAFSAWEEYPRMIGRVWVGRREGEKVSGHGPRGPFRVRVARPEDPIVRGIEDFDADDELYAKLVGDARIDVLLEADSDWSGRTEPIAWTLRYGEGRVFVTVLGHDAAARKTEPFKKLLEQGTRWAAGRLEGASAERATTR